MNLLRRRLDAPGIARYARFLGARYDTMRYAFERFVAVDGRVVVELGTSRSFVSGHQRGCMVNDRRYWQPSRPKAWDWGAGLFTRMAAEHLAPRSPRIHTVDVSPDAIAISRVITADFAWLITYHVLASEQFLSSFEHPIDLLYMDTGETGPEASLLHLREATIVVRRELLSPHAIVLIDDVDVPGQPASKGTLSIPYFRAHGFDVVRSGYQAVLERPR